MNDHLQFEHLADLARREPIPPIDVAARVAERIESRSSSTPVDWSLWSAAGLSVATAAVVLVLSFQQGVFFEDPLADWLRPLIMVIQ